jgi:ubiquinone/menaquinone biosynthesis C-methylase UbiE
MKVLDFGCGQAKTAGSIGMDIYPGEGVDVVHDFNVFPYPFADDTFDEIICNSSLEHVGDFMQTVVELHRIAKPSALLKVIAPHFSGPDAYRDPTHKTFFASTTFNFFAQGGSYRSDRNGLFSVERQMFGVPQKTGFVKSLFKSILNRMPDFYESRLCWILPAKTIYYELRVLK